ncbi:glycosyltransferase [Microbacterium sp. NPDC058062]|uniref:glycosyltransferase n=1 Tax=Microbacterium sp. NPDC058062 TaxID=3346320 RepID=UPI0036DEED12
MTQILASKARTGPTSNTFWPRSTSLFLLLVGLVLAVTSFIVVMNMPELPWHSARDAELRATYDAYRTTGTLLIKETGSGSYYTQAPASGPWSSAAWDDDPGSYMIASLMSHVTGSDSPYPGLGLVQALLISIPLLWLPMAVARIFRRARAGYAMLLLPALMWIVNNGTVLIGTEFGLSDEIATLRVYALYGIAASMAFLSLTLLLLFSTYRLRLPALLGASLLIGVLAGFGNLARSLSGMGIAAAVAVLWWLNSTGRWRWAKALAAGVLAMALAFGVQTGAMSMVNAGRVVATGESLEQLPDAHGVWHPLYLGLAWPEPITGQPSRFGIEWSDEFGWNKAREVNPDVIIASEEYDLILKDYYLDAVASDPIGAVKVYVQKTLFVIKHFGAMIIFIVVGFVLALTRRSPQRRPLVAALAIALPTLALGFVPPVLVMPYLYYFSELSAALGMLTAVALGAFVWSITSMPSHVRALERTRLSTRIEPAMEAADHVGLSVVVPTRNGEQVIGDTLATLGRELSDDDEIVVVENGSTDGTVGALERLTAEWTARPALVVLHSSPGLGEALRTGLLATRGSRVLLSADDLPFGLTDLEHFRTLPEATVVAIGSKAHPQSDVVRGWRRSVQSRIFRFLREALLQSRVGDSQGTIWVAGPWGRSFALQSRETGLMWTTELVLAAEQQGIRVTEVPVRLSNGHEKGASRFRFSDAWQSVVGFTRLAIYKDDYCNEDWTRSTRADDETAAEVETAPAVIAAVGGTP